ncbi:unnamed protein product [Echinostoma caproni]|uniref:PKcGMP_CC domain-containing protein n=1 Tax=Echinostoma caproni TaxID=27848 RepID=A0A183B3X1_9TREM|nr:unnamed protein product [Echinostoma caproni]
MTTKGPVQQSQPFTALSTVSEAQLQTLQSITQNALDLGQNFSVRSGNIQPQALNKSSTDHSDLSELPRNPSLSKIGTSSDSSSGSPQLQTDSTDLGMRRPSTGSRNAALLLNGNYTNWPQSPILISSPFNNPGYELERLSLQRELDEVRQRLDSKEDELEAIKRQRDFVAEHLRDSLGVIQKLFHSLHVSPSDLSRPLYVDTDHPGTGSDPSTGGYSATGLTASEVSPMPDEEDPIGTEHPHHVITESAQMNSVSQQHSPGNTSNEVLLDRRQLQQQQEALAALFANPFVTALLNSTNSGLDPNVGLGVGANSVPLWSRTAADPPTKETCLTDRSAPSFEKTGITGIVNTDPVLTDSKGEQRTPNDRATTQPVITGSTQTPNEVHSNLA